MTRRSKISHGCRARVVEAPYASARPVYDNWSYDSGNILAAPLFTHSLGMSEVTSRPCHAACRVSLYSAPRVALDVCQRSPARRLLGAVRWTCAALWPPTAAALSRTAFAGGLIPFTLLKGRARFLRHRVPSLQCFIPSLRMGRRGVVLARVSAMPRTMSVALLLVTVLVSGAEAHGSGGALIYRVFRGRAQPGRPASPGHAAAAGSRRGRSPAGPGARAPALRAQGAGAP